jgi:glucosamine 6-phosphate synthetase-like amidotransferase/phosphosugar isomerase protein
MSTLMMQSILEQPDAFRRLLAAGLKAELFTASFLERKVRKVWIVGSGTSLYAAMIAARSWEQELGIDCEAASSLEFLDETETDGLSPGVLVLAISQSGASLILLEGIRRANAGGAMTAVVTAHPEAPIPLEAGFVIETLTGPEANLGKTKGFTTTALAAILLGRRLAMGTAPDADAILRARYAGLPAALEETIQVSRALAAGWAEKFREADALFVVGAGTQVPTALEGALKILEVAKMPIVPKELEEMMHGPFNGVGPASGIVVIAGETARGERLSAFIEGVRLIGTASVTIAAGSAVAKNHDSFDLVLPPCDDAAIRAILGVVPFQFLAHDLAAVRGVPIDTARYPQLYPVFVSKSIHQ